MRKVFIGVLAALMLVAFTACEPQATEWPYYGEDAKNVMSITLVTPSDVVLHAGETFDTVYTGIDIVYKDNTSASNVTAEVSLAGAAEVGQNKMTVKWGGEFDNTGFVIVDAREVNEVVLTVEDTTDLAAAPTKGDVTYKYSDGFEVTAEDVDLKKTADADSVYYTLPAGTRSSADVTSNAVEYTLAAGPADPEYGNYSIYWSLTSGGEEAEDLYIGETVHLVVMNESSTTNDKYAITDSVQIVDSKNVLLSDTQKTAVLSQTLTATAGATYTVRYNGENIGTFQIPAGKNYMTSSSFTDCFTVTATPATPGVTTISADLFTFDASKLQYKVTLADAPCEDGVKVVSVKDAGLIIPSDATTSYPITVNIDVTVKGVTTQQTVTLNVPVQAAQADNT